MREKGGGARRRREKGGFFGVFGIWGFFVEGGGGWRIGVGVVGGGCGVGGVGGCGCGVGGVVWCWFLGGWLWGVRNERGGGERKSKGRFMFDCHDTLFVAVVFAISGQCKTFFSLSLFFFASLGSPA